MREIPMPAASFFRKYRWWILAPFGLAIVLILAAVLTVAVISPRLTPYLEGPEFRAELDKQTSKGLHFNGKYSRIERTGFDTAKAEEFHATSGRKAMKSLDAQGITAQFNPWGVLLRRWQLEYVRIKSGEVEVQTYEPKPDPKPPRPWYGFLLPDRVYLREVLCERANIKWRAEGRPGGIFDTRVRILPYGRDFEYFATGGTLRSGGFAPELGLKKLHLVITKKFLRVHRLELFPPDDPAGSLSLTGEMGMRENKQVDFTLNFEDIPIAPWLPEDLRAGIKGAASGRARWIGSDQTLESSSGEGELRVRGGELRDLALLDFLASAAAKKSLESLTLSECSVTFRWKYPKFEITALDLTAREKVALRGSLTVTDGSLSSQFDLGLAPAYLAWLPKARETVFTREEAGLLWTKVKLSGTLKNPVDDLTPRLAAALKKDPAAAAALFLRSVGEWFEQKTKGQ
jgi:hypothetical protein